MAGLRINGLGCCLLDFVYNRIDFSGDTFQKYASQKEGDGGLSPGKLVFTEELESFSGKEFSHILKEFVDKRDPDAYNVGGPAIVSLINASQLLVGKEVEVNLYGVLGNDAIGNRILEIVGKTPLNIDNYKQIKGVSPFTNVFSDPNFNNGHGERTFVNNIGAAWNLKPENLDESFFDANMVVFGATALVPHIHDNLTVLLQKAKSQGAFTLVNTVYDFRNEKRNPQQKWPLGKSDESFKLIDLLIMDEEESLRLSGCNKIEAAYKFFMERGTAAFLITRGAESVLLYSNGSSFDKPDLGEMLVSETVKNEIKNHPEKAGDTTGCGDNFVGGVISSIANQMLMVQKSKLDLKEACAWGIASGGFACFYMGGTFLEQEAGEKLRKVENYYQTYLNQLEND